jgi:hypothetical protein
MNQKPERKDPMSSSHDQVGETHNQGQQTDFKVKWRKKSDDFVICRGKVIVLVLQYKELLDLFADLGRCWTKRAGAVRNRAKRPYEDYWPKTRIVEETVECGVFGPYSSR